MILSIWKQINHNHFNHENRCRPRRRHCCSHCCPRGSQVRGVQRRTPEECPQMATKIATTRVPVSDDNYQNPSFSYRYLGTIGDIPFQIESPGAVVNAAREVFAMDSKNDLASTSTFCRTRLPLGFNFDCHFLVIFQTPHPLLTPLQSISEHSLFSSTHSDIGSHTPSPLLSRDTSTADTFSPNSISEANMADILHSDIFLSASSGFGSLEGENNCSADVILTATANSTSFASTRRVNPEENHVAQTAIAQYCIDNGASQDDLTEAKYRSDTHHKSLFNMVKNFKALSVLLCKVGLPGYRQDPNCTMPTAIIVAGDLSFKSDLIIRDRGWTIDTYKKKAKAYLWAEKAVTTKKWKGPPPGIVD